jgi:hypothetical protein
VKHALALGLVALAACRAPAPTASADPAQAALRALAKVLGDADPRIAGTSLEARGPREELGDSLFGTAAPSPAEIDAAFRRHCQPTAPPERERTGEGYARTTYRGVEPRSGASCVLVTDVAPGGRWRYVLRIRRGGGP